MPNGKPGDHPLTDLLVHGMHGYSAEADALIVEIARLVSRRELNELFDWGQPPALPQFTKLLREKRDELFEQARARGWDPTAAVPGAGAVEDLLKVLQLRSEGADSLELWVSDRLTLGETEVPASIAMAIVLDKALSLGLEPDGFQQGDGGRTYRYRRT